MVSITELAKACGVSVAAVSKAMNGKKGIGAEKAAMVRAKAKELGYYPNAAARTMRTNRSRDIGILYENGMGHEYFSLVFEAVRFRAAERGYDITILSGDPASGPGYLGRALNRQCDGILIVQGDFAPGEIEKVLQGPLPVVSVDTAYPGRVSVVNDNRRSMTEIVSYLAGQGHTRLAYIHGESCGITEERLAGFYEGCASCGIKVPETRVLAARFHDPEASARATRELLSQGELPTCILYPDDVSALGGITELTSRGLRVPEDISCFGYDGIRLAGLLRPHLSTYRQDAAALGAAAVDALLAEIEGTADPGGERLIVIPGRIGEGGTVSKIG